MAFDPETPTTSEMLEWRNILASEWESTGEGTDSISTEQKEEVKTYFQQFELISPHGMLGVKTGSAPSDADAAIDSLVPDDVIVSVKPARNRKKYQAQARAMKLWGKGLIEAWRKRKDVLRLVVSNQVIRRFGVMRILYDRAAWPGRPETLAQAEDESDDAYEDRVIAWEARNRRRTPITMESRDPRYCRWRESSDGDMLAMCEDYYAWKLDVLAALGNYPQVGRILAGIPMQQRVRVSDVWLGKFRCLFVEDRPVFEINTTPSRANWRGVGVHGYPRIPYIPVPFRELPFDSPAQRYRGMLSNSAGLYQIESQVLTMTVWLLAWNAWRTYKGWTKDGRALEIKPGQYVPIDQRVGEYLELLDGRPFPPELLQTAAVIDSYIQRNGVAQGPRTAEGTRSAQQLWAIQAMRQLKIESPKDNLQRALGDALSLSAEILETMIKEPMTLPVSGKDKETKEPLGEVTLRPDDIDGYYDGFKVVFSRRIDPALIEQAKAMMTFAVNNWMPQELSVEMSGLTDDVDEWMDMLMIQATERLPAILEIIGLKRAETWWGKDSDEAKIYAQKLLESKQQSSLPGGAPGVPPGGGGGLTAPSPKGQTQPGGNNVTVIGGGLSQASAMHTSGRPRGRGGAPGATPSYASSGTPGASGAPGG